MKIIVMNDTLCNLKLIISYIDYIYLKDYIF